MDKVDIKILYVEDEAVVRGSIARSLWIICDNVMTAENGMEAMEMLKTYSCDLIITDIQMPRMNGLEFIEKLRNFGLDIPVIITSAFSDIVYFKRAIDLKVEKFINKPIRVDHLFDLVMRIAESITTRRSLSTRHRELEYYRQAIDTTNFVIRLNNQGELISMNKDLYTFFNHTPANSSQTYDIKSLLTPEVFEELIQTTKNLNIFNQTTVMNLEGETYTVQITAFASVLHHDGISEVTIILNNLSPIVQQKDEIIQNLFTDTLTGLPNRQKLFSDLLESETEKAVMIIDIERFSNINYLYGFDMGDAILKQVADILLNFWPDDRPRTLYRSDTDHFVILTEKMKEFNFEKMKELAEAIIRKIESHDFSYNNITIEIGVTGGGSCLGIDDIYTEALIALSIAKEEHKSFLCYTELDNIKERFNINIQMQRAIKKAIDNDLIINYYHPIVDAQKQIIKYEALIRMIDPNDRSRVLSPFQFLEIAKESKNYSLLTKKVIQNAFRDFGDGKYAVTINLSYDDIANPDIFVFLEQHVMQYPKARVTLELLESEGLKDMNKTILFCNQMKEYGMSIAIDDFGSGYSNFTNLFDIPIDVLKLDGQLIRRVHEPRGQALIKSIVTIAKEFGLTTVAEYVETDSIFEKLQAFDIDLYQGYFFSEPKPFEKL